MLTISSNQVAAALSVYFGLFKTGTSVQGEPAMFRVKDFMKFGTAPKAQSNKLV